MINDSKTNSAFPQIMRRPSQYQTQQTRLALPESYIDVSETRKSSPNGRLAGPSARINLLFSSLRY